MSRNEKPKRNRMSKYANKIDLPFEKIVEGMLQVKPKKKPAPSKKPPMK